MYARYTEYLRDIMQNELSRPLLDKALSTYPLYANEKAYDLIPTREQLNKKLLDHWKYHEIGFETVGRFLDELEITMCEIMPHYNELFKTVVTMAELPNPFDNVDVVETFEQERHDSSTAEGNTSSNQTASGKTDTSNDTTNTGTASEETSGSSESFGKSIRTDTPGDDLSITAKGIDSVDYATEVNWDHQTAETEGSSQKTSTDTSKTTASTENESTASETGNTSSSSESSGTTKHTYTKKGNQGVNTYAHDMNEFRTSIIDVVDQIISDLRIAELFMQVY